MCDCVMTEKGQTRKASTYNAANLGEKLKLKTDCAEGWKGGLGG